MTESTDATARQRRFYEETALSYDDMHLFEEHQRALWHITGYLERLDARSVLDTGCGTGQALRYLSARLPDVRFRGNDPSKELLEVATSRHGIDADLLEVADSTALPFADGSFDAVVATGVMHHVPEPDLVIGEMLRVAAKAVFISDTNRFGMGPLPKRVLKLALARARVWRRLNRARLGGHDWHYSEGDGVAYSYSVYESLALLRGHCAEVVVIPTGGAYAANEGMALLTSSHCLVCAFKEPLVS